MFNWVNLETLCLSQSCNEYFLRTLDKETSRILYKRLNNQVKTRENEEKLISAPKTIFFSLDTNNVYHGDKPT